MKNLLTVTSLCVFVIGGTAIFGVSQNNTKPPRLSCALSANKESLDILLRGAITAEDEDCVNLVLSTGLSPSGDLPRMPGSAPVLIAALRNKPGIMAALFRAGVDPKSGEAGDAFRIAAGGGRRDVLKVMLDAGVDPNAGDSDGLTALMIAAERGHIEIVDLLLERKADANAKLIYGITPLMMASDNVQVLRSLLNAGAVLDMTDKKGQTALFFAVRRTHIKKVEYLLKEGADPNHRDINGITPLILAEQLPKSKEKPQLLELLRRATVRNPTKKESI